jgi:hypothetical protein
MTCAPRSLDAPELPAPSLLPATIAGRSASRSETQIQQVRSHPEPGTKPRSARTMLNRKLGFELCRRLSGCVGT